MSMYTNPPLSQANPHLTSSYRINISEDDPYQPSQVDNYLNVIIDNFIFISYIYFLIKVFIRLEKYPRYYTSNI